MRMALATFLCLWTGQVSSASEGGLVLGYGDGLAAGWGSGVDNGVSLDLTFGDGVGYGLVDTFVSDRDSFFAALGYRRYFGAASVKVPEQYRSEPWYALDAGYGNWEIKFVVPLEYDIFRGGGGFALPLGDQALLEVEAHYAATEFPIAGEADIYVVENRLALLKDGNMCLRLGWIYDRYEFSSGAANHRSIEVSAGYLWGDTEQGLDVSFAYRGRSENNGGDDESDYITIGLEWYVTRTVSLAVRFRDVSGQLDSEYELAKVMLSLRPAKGFRVDLGVTTSSEKSSGDDYTNFNVGVSYDF